MSRRVLAFALAFVIIGVPLAGDICDAVCLEHAGSAIEPTVLASHHHHSPDIVRQPLDHHHSDAAAAPATRSAELVPLPHGCGRLDAIVTESRELTPAPIVKAVATMARITPLLVRASPASEMDSRHGPSTPIRSTSALRI
jgi:hypothetical protein